jgi:hypothetical protein
MKALQRIIIASVVGLIVHASLLATLPIVWCIGPHGHEALESRFFGLHHGLQTPSVAKADVEREAMPIANDQHPIDCIDCAPIAPFCGVQKTTQSIDFPSFLPSVAPLPLLTTLTPVVQFGPNRTCNGPAGAPQLAHLRSVVLRI